MVNLIIIGKAEQDQFCYSTNLTTEVGVAVQEVTDIWNSRILLRWYSTCGASLAKSPNCQGVSQMEQVMGEIDLYLKRKDKTAPVTLEEMKRLETEMKAAVLIGFPQASAPEALQKRMESLETPAEEQLEIQQILNITLDANVAESQEMLDPATSVLWAFNKAWSRAPENTIGKQTNQKNEKTAINVKLTKEGSGAPARPPPVDHKTQQEMMAYWHKRQEEDKRMNEDEDISYGDRSWSDTRSLKNQFQGTGDIKLPPGVLR